MKRGYIYILVLSALMAAAVACTKDDTALPEPVRPETSDRMIRWQVKAEQPTSATTRTMIGSTATGGSGTGGSGTPTTNSADCISLEQACDIDGTLNHGIGFWADYIRRDGLTEYVTRDVFGTNTQLVYGDPDNSDADNPHNDWNYRGTTQYWALGGRYLFRAFYPDLLKGYIERTSTNGELFVLSYNTHKYQEDLMVAYNEVFTVDPEKGGKASIYLDTDGTYSTLEKVTNHVDGKNIGDFHFSKTFDLGYPVPLKFEHTLSAIRFRFTFNYDDADELTSVALRNSEEGKGLHTTGLLLFGAYEPFKTSEHPEGDHQHDYLPADEGFAPFKRLNLDKRTFKWTSVPRAAADGEFYRWRIAMTDIDGNLVDQAQAAADGIPLYRTGTPFWRRTAADGTVTERMAIAYTDSRDYAERVTSGSTVTEKPKVHAVDEERLVWMGEEYETVGDLDSGGNPIWTSTRRVSAKTGKELYYENGDPAYVPRTYYTVATSTGVPLVERHTRPAEIFLDPSNTMMNDPADPARQDPPTFASNEGWLLILPQQADGTARLRFTTAETGDTGVTELKIPAFTGTKYGTDADGLRYGVEYTDADEANRDDYCHYIPGMRYTYTVVIGKTNLYLNISVDPWRERWANTEIIF